METVAILKKKVASYLQRAPADFVMNDIDLLLHAINSAHRYAQRQHDFMLSEVSVGVSVSLSTGALLSTALLYGTETAVTVKKILRAYLGNASDGFRPIGFTTASQRYADLNVRLQPRLFDEPVSSAEVEFYPPYISQSGGRIYLFPTNTDIVGNSPVTVRLDVIQYLPDLADGDDGSDSHILEYGEDFIFWDSVVRLAYINRDFAARTEGNVPPPMRERAEAWENLKAWDAGLRYTGDTALTLD